MKAHLLTWTGKTRNILFGSIYTCGLSPPLSDSHGICDETMVKRGRVFVPFTSLEDMEKIQIFRIIILCFNTSDQKKVVGDMDPRYLPHHLYISPIRIG
jgi:hypothetical protein